MHLWRNGSRAALRTQYPSDVQVRLLSGVQSGSEMVITQSRHDCIMGSNPVWTTVVLHNSSGNVS